MMHEAVGPSCLLIPVILPIPSMSGVIYPCAVVGIWSHFHLVLVTVFYLRVFSWYAGVNQDDSLIHQIGASLDGLL
jgi:hypothetical protein